MIELKFNKGNPPKDGRYICLLENTSDKVDQYICFGSWIYNHHWILEGTNITPISNHRIRIVGWCEFEYKGE